MPMTSRQRVQAVLDHQVPDRVPICIGASNATGIKVKPYQGLKKILGIQGDDRYIYDWPELGTVLPEEAVLQRLHSDFRPVLDRFPKEVIERNQKRPAHTPYIDDWKSGQTEIEPGVWFPGVHPLAQATTVEEIEKFPWPDMNDPYRVALVREQARQLSDQNQFAILATPWLMFPFERAFSMQGMDKFLLNLAMHPEFAQALLRKITDLCLVHLGHFLDECGQYIDIIKIGDDLGTQERLLISPRMYRQMLKPLHAEIIQTIRQRTKAKVFFHSDGDIFDLIEDFIEIGVDILNPVQTSAGKMSDLAALKASYQGRMVFCGAIDTQKVLPFGTPEEVRQEVRRVINLLGRDGGYMLASVHTIMNEVPAENILAMVDAVEEYGVYPLKG
jgi:uroporphyrinogen decarboxylase